MEIAHTKTPIELEERCKSCTLKTYQKLFEKFSASLSEQHEFISFHQEAMRKYKHYSTPEIQRELNNAFCRIIKVSDPFKEEKAHSNAIALEVYKEWKPKVLASADPFDLALRLAIAGNIMDYGANNNFDLHKTIQSVLGASFAIDHTKLLNDRIRKAKRILYLGDNAGEIVLDKLFIETTMPDGISYAVKGSPVLNDVTMEDAQVTGIDLVTKVISNGFDAPSTILKKCSSEFLEVYNSADLIISKGQGNLEGLINEKDERIFFLLMVKCTVMAENLGVKKGSFVVYNPNEHGKN